VQGKGDRSRLARRHEPLDGHSHSRRRHGRL
jgi:hypothetical protein